MNIPSGKHIQNLPLDIVLDVLSHVDTASLVRCTRISKGWRSFLFSDGVSAFRSFWPDDVQSSRFPSLRQWFDRVAGFAASARGVLQELRVQEGVISDSTALQLVSYSAGNLVRLDLQLMPKGSTRELIGGYTGAFWDIQTAQDGLNEAVNCILTSCPNLLHLSLSSPYGDVAKFTATYCREFIVPPSFSDSRKPQLRSLRLCDLKPRYDVHFYRLVEHVHTLVIAGEGLQRDVHSGVWSPASLRVLLRSLERGGNIRLLELEEPFEIKDQAALSLFSGISENLVSPDEIDRRWETERSAYSALQEKLVDDLIYDPDGNEYGRPRVVSLPHLEKLRVVSGLSMISDGISVRLEKRNRELSRIVAPHLENLFVDCAALNDPLESLTSSIDPPHRLRSLTLLRPDPEMTIDDMLDFLRGLPGIEELSFIFTYAGGCYYSYQELFDFKSLLHALSVPSSGDATHTSMIWVLPRLKKLRLVDDEQTGGKDLAWFIRARRNAYDTWLKNRGSVAVEPCLPIESLSLYSGRFSPYKILRREMVKWLCAHLISFNEEREERTRPGDMEQDIDIDSDSSQGSGLDDIQFEHEDSSHRE